MRSMFTNLVQILTKPDKFWSKRERNNDEVDLNQIARQEQKLFLYETLAAATNNFHPTQKLGEGGFGPVYRGKLDDGREIAVKKLSYSSNQGKREFLNEVKLLARVQHRNIVDLLGCCVHGRDKLLVYEYISNQSLDKILFKSNSRREEVGWTQRYEIIKGVARGLLYLHEDAHDIIIHRDIKAGNILVDDNWEPKIADFGLARLFPEDGQLVYTRIAGTNGYMAPEYVMRGQLSVKADVYSFGVLVLELITGKRITSFKLSDNNFGAKSLLDWAYEFYEKGRSLMIVDPTILQAATSEQEVEMCIRIGLLCTQGDPQLRPTMQSVVVMLSKKPGNNLEQIPGSPGAAGSRYWRRSGPLLFTSIPRNSSGSGSGSGSSSKTTATTATTTSLSSGLDIRGKHPIQD